MIETLLLIITLLCSLLLIGAVLVQPGKADMISGMGGFGGSMSNVFGVRQSRNMLQNITIGLMVVIALVSILMNTGLFMGGSDSNSGDAMRDFKVQNSGQPRQQQAIPVNPQPAPPAQQ